MRTMLVSIVLLAVGLVVLAPTRTLAACVPPPAFIFQPVHQAIIIHASHVLVVLVLVDPSSAFAIPSASSPPPTAARPTPETMAMQRNLQGSTGSFVKRPIRVTD